MKGSAPRNRFEPAPLRRFEPTPTLAVAGLLAVFLVANRAILLGHGYPLWDADRQFSAWQMLIGDFARHRELLLWNPWSSGGVPDFADPQSGALSPLAVLAGFIAGGGLAAFNLWWLLNWFAGGVGMFFLGRHLRAPWWGSFAVALGFLFSGFYLGHAEHISWIHSFSFLPWLIWWFDRAARERSTRLAFETAALFGLSGLAGYPGLLIVTGAVLPWWALGRALDCAPEDDGGGWASSPPLRRLLKNLAIVLAIGGAVLAPVYAGYFTEGAGYSTRIQSGGWTRESAVSSNALHPGAFATLASPWGSEVQLYSGSRFWAGTDASSCSMYVGPFIPFLVLAALIAKPKARWRWWLAASIALALALAVGDRLPLRGWLYDYFPPFRYFRHPTMFRGIAIFLAAVLALLGARDLAHAPERARRTAVGMLLPSLALGGAAFFALQSLLRAGERWEVPGRALAAGHAAVWLIPIAIAGFALHARWRRWIPAVLVTSAILDGVLALHLGRNTVYTENIAARQSWQVLKDRHVASLDLLANGRPRILRTGRGISHNKNLPPKIPTLVNYTALINTHHERLAELPSTAAIALGRDRIWFARSAVEAPASETVTRALLDQAAAGPQLPLVVHPRESMPGTAVAADSAAVQARIASAEPIAPADLTWREYTPRRLALTARCPDRGWLFVTDRWSPGWQATVNGRATRVLGANQVFRAVAVEAGANDVRMSYRPWAWPWLLVMSWGLLAVALASAGARVLLRQTGHAGIRELTIPPGREPPPGECQVSIVIPAYNAGHHIAHTLASLGAHIRQSDWNAEILVVDDGSEDSTRSAVESAGAGGDVVLRLLQHERNLGKGRAVRTGMLAARGRKLVFTDSDLPYSLKDLSAVVAALDDVDVAAGSRSTPGRRTGATAARQLSSKSFSAMVSRWFGLPSADTQCGLKGFTRAAAHGVFSRCRVNGFSFDVEALAIARARGLRVRAVPVVLRRSQPSSVRLVRHSLQMLAELIAIQLNLTLGRYR